MNRWLRLFLACGLLSTWLLLLMTGYVLDGWSHLLLIVALVVFPWRELDGPRQD